MHNNYSSNSVRIKGILKGGLLGMFKKKNKKNKKNKDEQKKLE